MEKGGLRSGHFCARMQVIAIFNSKKLKTVTKVAKC